MRRLFPISIGFPGVSGNPLRFVAPLFTEQVLKGFIVREFNGALLFGSLRSLSHSGDLPC
jgi:hypothetical protein